jgi:hypothetical protein
LPPEASIALHPPQNEVLLENISYDFLPSYTDDTQNSSLPDYLDLSHLEQLFCLRIPTVKAIPRKCRFQVAEAYLTSLELVLRDPSSISNWICLLLFPLCVLHRPPHNVFPCTMSRSQFQIRNIFRALNLWCKGIPGISLLIEHLSSCFSSSLNTPALSSSISACKNKVASGQYRSALKILEKEGLAPNDDMTYEILSTLDPQKPLPNHIPSSTFPFPESSCSYALILQAIRSFPKDPAP